MFDEEAHMKMIVGLFVIVYLYISDVSSWMGIVYFFFGGNLGFTNAK